MNLQSQYFLFDIDNTITRYCKEAIPDSEWLLGNCFLSVIRNLLQQRGWNREDAEQSIRQETYNVDRWDYSDLICKLGIPWQEAADAMRARHNEVLTVYADTVEAIRTLKGCGAHICIVSNNPFWGCRWKLERAGLTPDIFDHIFSTDHTGGCKSLDYVWKFVIPRIGAPSESINTVGDDCREDCELPLAFGAGRSFILINRNNTITPFDNPNRILLEDSMQIPEYFRTRGF